MIHARDETLPYIAIIKLVAKDYLPHRKMFTIYN